MKLQKIISCSLQTGSYEEIESYHFNENLVWKFYKSDQEVSIYYLHTIGKNSEPVIVFKIINFNDARRKVFIDLNEFQNDQMEIVKESIEIIIPGTHEGKFAKTFVRLFRSISKNVSLYQKMNDLIHHIHIKA